MTRAKGGSKAPSQRQLRVGELVRHALSEILMRGDVHDPVLEGAVVTVSEVRASPDLKQTTAFIMPLGGAREKEILAALNRNRKFIRGEIAHRVELKYAPEVHFRLDESFDEAQHIDELLRSDRVARDLDPRD